MTPRTFIALQMLHAVGGSVARQSCPIASRVMKDMAESDLVELRGTPAVWHLTRDGARRAKAIAAAQEADE